MDIYNESLFSATNKIEKQKNVTLRDKEEEFNKLFGLIEKYKNIDEKCKILEIGVGIGWVVAMCQQKGISCKGIDISPELVNFAKEWCKRETGLEPDIELGNIEENNIGINKYDIIIATSTFEHVELWKRGLTNVFNALKPGGLFYFYSTNKFSYGSGEWKSNPFYGWLPDSVRYRFRIKKQGNDIMKLGIDFNQFTYFQLRTTFKKLGYSTILDSIDIIDSNKAHFKPWKRITLKILKRIKPLKYLALIFWPGTSFVCRK